MVSLSSGCVIFGMDKRMMGLKIGIKIIFFYSSFSVRSFVYVVSCGKEGIGADI